MDALVVFQALRASNNYVSLFGLILDDCLSLANDVYDISFSFVRRFVIHVAHELARTSVSWTGPMFWDIDVPAFLHSSLTSNLS